MLNGFPVRLVVPGWYATYWVKALSEITVLAHPFDGYWMAKAYRIPANPEADESPDALAKQTVPINRMNLRSFFVRPTPRPHPCRPAVSPGGHRLRRRARDQAGAGLDRRRRPLVRRPSRRGPRTVLLPPLARHLDAAGAGRPPAHGAGRQQRGRGEPGLAAWNRSGYMRNVIEEISVTAV